MKRLFRAALRAALPAALMFLPVFVQPGLAEVKLAPAMSQPQLELLIQRSKRGDTVVFTPGTYTVAKLRILPDRIYRGDGAVLQSDGSGPIIDTDADGVTLTNFTFDGNGIFLEGARSGWKIYNNTFQNITNTRDNHASNDAIYAWILSNSEISGNTFRNILFGGKTAYEEHYGNGIFIEKGFSQGSIHDNTFDHVYEGIHIFYSEGTNTNVSITNNHFRFIHRIAIESQNANIDGLLISGNTLSDPLDPYWSTYGISAAQTGSHIVVSNNVMNGNVLPKNVGEPVSQHNYMAYGLEIWGQNVVVTGNVVEGYWGIGIGFGIIKGATVKDNAFCGPPEPYGGATTVQYEGNQGQTQTGLLMTSNTRSTALTCTAPQPSSAPQPASKTGARTRR